MGIFGNILIQYFRCRKVPLFVLVSQLTKHTKINISTRPHQRRLSSSNESHILTIFATNKYTAHVVRSFASGIFSAFTLTMHKICNGCIHMVQFYRYQCCFYFRREQTNLMRICRQETISSGFQYFFCFFVCFILESAQVHKDQ